MLKGAIDKSKDRQITRCTLTSLSAVCGGTHVQDLCCMSVQSILSYIHRCHPYRHRTRSRYHAHCSRSHHHTDLRVRYMHCCEICLLCRVARCAGFVIHGGRAGFCCGQIHVLCIQICVCTCAAFVTVILASCASGGRKFSSKGTTASGY